MKFNRPLESSGLVQHVAGPTQHEGHPLDVVITRTDVKPVAVLVEEPSLSDHSSVVADTDRRQPVVSVVDVEVGLKLRYRPLLCSPFGIKADRRPIKRCERAFSLLQRHITVTHRYSCAICQSDQTTTSDSIMVQRRMSHCQGRNSPTGTCSSLVSFFTRTGGLEETIQVSSTLSPGAVQGLLDDGNNGRFN